MELRWEVLVVGIQEFQSKGLGFRGYEARV